MAILFKVLSDGYTAGELNLADLTSAVPTLNQYGDQRVVIDSGGMSVSATNPLAVASTPVLSTAAKGSTWQTSVTGTAAKVNASSTNFANGFIVTNLSSSALSVFIGFSNSVTTSTGLEIVPGGALKLNIADASTVWVIAAGATQTITGLGD